jgi:hypothetical protein
MEAMCFENDFLTILGTTLYSMFMCFRFKLIASKVITMRVMKSVPTKHVSYECKRCRSFIGSVYCASASFYTMSHLQEKNYIMIRTSCKVEFLFFFF